MITSGNHVKSIIYYKKFEFLFKNSLRQCGMHTGDIGSWCELFFCSKIYLNGKNPTVYLHEVHLYFVFYEERISETFLLNRKS